MSETMSLFMCGANFALLFLCAEQSMKDIYMCGANLLHIYKAFILCSAHFLSNADFALPICRAMQTMLFTWKEAQFQGLRWLLNLSKFAVFWIKNKKIKIKFRPLNLGIYIPVLTSFGNKIILQDSTFKSTVQKNIYFFKKWSYCLNRSLKWQWLTKFTLKE